MPLEFSLAYFTPILAFLLVITLVYALLTKTKILGENASLNFLISFVIAIIFMITPLARTYALEITPWLSVFLVTLFFFILIISFTGDTGILKSRGLSIAIIVILLALFVVSGVNVFGSLINHYLSFIGLSLSEVKDKILQPTILGILALLVIGVALSFWLTKK